MNIKREIAALYPDQVFNASRCRVTSMVRHRGGSYAIEPSADGWACRLLHQTPMATRRRSFKAWLSRLDAAMRDLLTHGTRGEW